MSDQDVNKAQSFLQPLRVANCGGISQKSFEASNRKNIPIKRYAGASHPKAIKRSRYSSFHNSPRAFDPSFLDLSWCWPSVNCAATHSRPIRS